MLVRHPINNNKNDTIQGMRLHFVQCETFHSGDRRAFRSIWCWSGETKKKKRRAAHQQKSGCPIERKHITYLNSLAGSLWTQCAQANSSESIDGGGDQPPGLPNQEKPAIL